ERRTRALGTPPQPAPIGRLRGAQGRVQVPPAPQVIAPPRTHPPPPGPPLAPLDHPRLDGLDGGWPPKTPAFPHSCPTCPTCPTLSGGSRNFYEYSTRPPSLYILLFTFI